MEPRETKRVGGAALRVVATSGRAQPRTLEQRVQLDRPAIYDGVMEALSERVDAAHRRLLRDRDVLPACLPSDRALKAEELEELTWRVFCLSTAMSYPLVRCHPSMILLAAMWWESDEPSWWEWFCEAHWP